MAQEPVDCPISLCSRWFASGFSGRFTLISLISPWLLISAFLIREISVLSLIVCFFFHTKYSSTRSCIYPPGQYFSTSATLRGVNLNSQNSHAGCSHTLKIARLRYIALDKFYLDSQEIIYPRYFSFKRMPIA